MAFARHFYRSAAATVALTLTFLLPAGCDRLDGASLPQVEAKVPKDFVPHHARGSPAVLKAPPSWKETSTSGVVALNLLTGRPGSSVNLVVVPADAGGSLDKTMGQLPNQLRHEIAAFKLLKRDFVVVNDLPAGRVVYEGSRNGFHGRLMMMLFHRGAKEYALTYAASPENYEQELPTVEQVIASLELP